MPFLWTPGSGSGSSQHDPLPGGIGSSRLSATAYNTLTMGPYTQFGTSTPNQPGSYKLGLSYVRAGTPETVAVNVVTALGSTTAYYVMYDTDDDGQPSNLVYSWGPFSTGAGGIVALTGQTTAISAGVYWCGAMTPAANGGNIALSGGLPAFIGPSYATNLGRPSLELILADSSPRAALTQTFFTTSVYGPMNNIIPTLFGKS